MDDMQHIVHRCGAFLAALLLAGGSHSAVVKSGIASLRGLPAGIGVAVLEATVRLGADEVRIVPRRQPIALPNTAARVRVVRIEASAGFAARQNERAMLVRVAEEIAKVGWEPGTAAVQIDFDARRSEREFYRRLLERVRERLPAQVPLTMTALVSWCSADDWIGSLPVAEATPMFFRMEPDRRRLVTSGDEAEFRVQEPLCKGSVGVSTGEPWPEGIAGKRVYVFAEDGWAREPGALRQISAGGGR
jgi:hypothetical protein